MCSSIGTQRRKNIAYACRWVDFQDAEDIVHDAYEVAIRRGNRPTSLRLAIKQSACKFLAARARGWRSIGDGSRLQFYHATLDWRIDLKAGLKLCDRHDFDILLNQDQRTRCRSRFDARRLRLAKRRVSNCLTEIC